jgi:splicing factor 45
MSLADWTAEDDDANGLYFDEHRERGGKKKKKKKKKADEEKPALQDWDGLYDPTRPNNYEEYIHSEERVREIKEWKDTLYAHRIAKHLSEELSSDDDRPRRSINGIDHKTARPQ